METCQGLFSYYVWQTHMSVPGHGNQLLTTFHLSQGKHVNVWNSPRAQGTPLGVGGLIDVTYQMQRMRESSRR